MPRWTLFLPFAALVIWAGFLGWRLGTPVSDTDIILHYAQIYAKETGGDPVDCHARPADAHIRMTVICQNKDGKGIGFEVSQRGGLIRRFQLAGSEP